MSVFQQILNPVRRVYRAIFHQQVSLSVSRGSVQVRLRDEQDVQPHAPSRAELSARKQQQDFNLMQHELRHLLDDIPETRTTLRHLAFVEQALQKKGLRALDKLPVDVLRRALEQLEGVVVNWSPVGLASLRAKMAVAIIDREHQSPAQAEADQYRTAAVLDSTSLADTRSFTEGVEVSTDDDALAAAYAALGAAAPVAAATVTVQSELGTSSAKAEAREASRRPSVPETHISLRGELSSQP